MCQEEGAVNLNVFIGKMYTWVIYPFLKIELFFLFVWY